MPQLEFHLENVRNLEEAYKIFYMAKNILKFGKFPIKGESIQHRSDTKRANYVFGTDLNLKEAEDFKEHIEDILSLGNKYKGIRISGGYIK